MTAGAREQGNSLGGMSTRIAPWLAWFMCALSLVLTVFGLLLVALDLPQTNTQVYDYWVENTILALAFSVVGGVVASRRPGHPIGWLFCFVGFIGGIRLLTSEYAIHVLVAQPGSLPGGPAAAWVSSWVWVAHVGLMVFLALLFPDGRLPSRRWRPLVWIVVAAVLIGTVAVALSPGHIDGLGPIQNPLGVKGMPNFDALLTGLSYALALVAASSLVLRFRRSRGLQRQQIKWFAYAGAVAAIGAVFTYIGELEATGVAWVRWTGLALVVVGFVGVPIAMGIAIMRYRLYEIDLVINRTLVYGSLTAMLALIYFGGVASTQAIFRALAGQEQQPQLAIVISTLMIAALFNPLRRRIQRFIDRRFYRSKYDAAKTLEAFSAKLRDETDLEALSDDLVGVVRETMQPARVSLWLRHNTAPKGEQPN
jgi:hypothetical protein